MDAPIRLLNVSDPIISLIESYRGSPLFPSLSKNWVPKITVSHTAIRVVLLNRMTYQIRKTTRVRFATVKFKFNIFPDGKIVFYAVEIPVAEMATHSVRIRVFDEIKAAFPFMRVTNTWLNVADIYQSCPSGVEPRQAMLDKLSNENWIKPN